METENLIVWEYHIAEPKKVRRIHQLMAERKNKSAMAVLARSVKRAVIDNLLDENAKEVTVPRELEGYPVIEIADRAFQDCKQLEAVEIPDSVSVIGAEVFGGCDRLTRVHLPESLSRIGHGMFKNCTGLTEVEFPNSLKSINFETFQGCTSLKRVRFPEDMFLLSSHTFENCVSLETLDLPEGLKRIEIGVFRNCKGLKELRIPDSVERIGGWAFEGCTGLKEISLPEGITKIEKKTFEDCSSLERIRIPASVINIGTDRLNWITAMEEENIGKVVQDNPLEGCDNLKEICVYEGSYAQQWAEENGYQSMLCLEELPLEYDINEETRTAVITGMQNRSMERLVIPGIIDNCLVTEIASEAFSLCENLTSVVIPETVQVIGAGAFYMCSNLRSMQLPASVKKIENTAVLGCTELDKIYVRVDSYAELWAEECGFKVIYS